jgi:hypothetical protein
MTFDRGEAAAESEYPLGRYGIHIQRLAEAAEEAVDACC